MRGLLKIGDYVLREYNRAESTLVRKSDENIDHKIYITRKKTDDKLFTELFVANEVVQIAFYENEQMLQADKPSEVYEDMRPVETGVAISPPSWSVQEKLVYESVQSLATS